MAVIFVCVYLLFMNNVLGYEKKSFKSNWDIGGKPILRLGPEGKDNNFKEESSLINKEVIDKARKITGGVLEKFGFNNVKSFVERLFDQVEKGKIPINVQQSFRVAKPNNVWPPTPPPEPSWLSSFKEYVKNLIERYGKETLDQRIEPLVKYIQQIHHIKITDIDIDQYGDVLVKWIKEGKKFA